MAKGTKKTSPDEPKKAMSLDALVGQSVKVDDGQGGQFLVPLGPSENRTANQILASQMRNYIQKQMKMYADGEKMLTPAELRQLAEAAAVVARFSGEVYEKAEVLPHAQSIKKVESVESPAEVVDFNDLTSKKTEEK